ncbi:MAG: hypothetical protein A3I11_04885 [Elusimicrobia bacterium RIFCSPLOWO2_02_FULL_39_32]|nr:MAG: hypothetical protein A2034_07830 [Elusimicrobia bacterium GWA2_38_7]OGR80111.1 MAG: hypothetical protein A3B80_00720 [Elusimicrobia bacterium RIFCSPHIGHO2_02_FULL_39_36]OGR91094.1 MAG: hypothetical protein A3I11_04885 [Elusimicrobia bacterium RIFCSPLOWO2_02_FULL_39_32]OGS00061.1 MAG: hypothetical protein A3G85_07850 [Elusimicrobia bacterium RIFCSPLOWO2_12_FULL_39_28]
MKVWFILISPFLTALLCALGRSPNFIQRVSVVGSWITCFLSGFVCLHFLTHAPTTLKSSALFIDAVGSYLAMIISVISLLVSILSKDFMNHEQKLENLKVNSYRTYYALFHVFVSTMLLVSIANNLGILWIMVEATTLSTAFLVGFHRHRHSIEAAWKYVILCSIGIAFALFGTILFYYSAVKSGLGYSLEWTTFIEIAPQLDPRIVKLGFIFIILGYGTKAGLAPLHTWLPDAHSQAPSPISAMLSGVLLTSAFYALTRFYAITVRCVGTEIPGTILLLFGCASLGIAAPFIIAARDYKRMLAYSSIEHMGLLTFGLGIGTPFAIYGMFLHILSHAFGKSLAFLSAGRILQTYGTRKIKKITGTITTMPETGISFFISILALAGLPPFSIFTSELMILSAGFASGKNWFSFLALIFLGLIFAGLLNHLVHISFGSNLQPKNDSHPLSHFSWNACAAFIIVILVVLGCWMPNSLNAWLWQMAQIIQGSSHV